MPYLINWFLYTSLLPHWWAYIYAVALFAASTSGSLYNYHAQLTTYKFGLRIRAATTTLIYRKALYAILGRTSNTGVVVNLMSTDAQLVLETLPLFMQGILAPIQIIVTLGLLSQYMHLFTLVSLAAAILAFPATAIIAGQFTSVRSKVQTRSDVRLKYVKEFLTAIRIVKYYAWEKPFVSNIEAMRKAQLVATRALLFARATLIVVVTNVPTLGVGLTFFFYGIKNDMEYLAIFSASTYLALLRVPFIFLPMLIAFVGQYLSAFQRITFFALRSEITPRTADADPDDVGGMRIENGDFSWETELSIAEGRFLDLEKLELDTKKLEDSSNGKLKSELSRRLKEVIAEKEWSSKVVHNLRLKHLRESQLSSSGTSTILESSFEAISDEETAKYPPLRKPAINLHDVSLTVERGKLTTVVGSVGSGKSTLAMAFLGEVLARSGSVWVSEEISFAAQEAWILNATIRDNITFGNPYDPVWYASVIRACALTTDLALFAASDLTEIGERGTNLSGGQRQRISVARAMYSKTPIVILDDPFSAVDAHVGEHMFTHVAKEMAKSGRTVLLVTNQLHFVPESDYCAVLKKGRIIEQGTMSSLLELEGGHLKRMLMRQSAANSLTVSVSEAERMESNNAREKMKTAKDIAFEPTPQKDEEYRMKGALIMAEEREDGNIGFGTYWQYIRAGGAFMLLLVVFFQGARTAMRVMGGIWLSWWSDSTNARGFSHGVYLGAYIAIVLGEILFIVVASYLFVLFAVKAGAQLHASLTHSVSRATTSWFDITPVGRIITRFSKDIDFIDVQLPQLVEQTINLSFMVLGVIASIAVGTPWILILFVIAALGCGALTVHYRKTSIQVQRLEALSRAPIFSHFTETLEGSVTIRAFGMAPAFKVGNMNKIDTNTVDFLALRYCSAWFGITLDLVGNTFVFLSYIVMIVVRLYAPNSIAVGYMIYAVSNSGGISQALGSFSNALTDLENKMNSAERVMQYFRLPEEAPAEVDETKPIDSWPSKGRIKIDDLVIEYNQGVPVLKNLSCDILPREKVGIVGRTGAGKSTLITALFRTVEPLNGSILIDDVDIKEIGLFDLRSRLSIIPQMPQLFVGTVRYNLDPFDEHPDEELWKVLKMVKLKTEIAALEGKLEANVEENGANFSVGQRQLLSMARCLLRRTHVLLLDEATAAVDVETDALLQRMIRKNFRDKTVLTIAHRLNTIMDSDRIMVLDAGQIVEFDTPANLLSKRDGVLYAMVEATGIESASYLRSIAFETVSVADSIVELSKSKDVPHSKEGFKSSEILSSSDAQISSPNPLDEEIIPIEQQEATSRLDSDQELSNTE